MSQREDKTEALWSHFLLGFRLLVCFGFVVFFSCVFLRAPFPGERGFWFGGKVGRRSKKWMNVIFLSSCKNLRKTCHGMALAVGREQKRLWGDNNSYSIMVFLCSTSPAS